MSRLSKPPAIPWDEWLDGSIWRLRRGEDFDVSAPTIQKRAHPAAQSRGLRVQTSVEDDDTIVLRAYVRDK